MIDTSGYRRFERVDAVEETARGIQATLHGERLRIDVVRDDVVRFKISRGGAFDESPTFAPNGRMILYASKIGGRGILAAVSNDGRVKQRLTVEAGDVREPAWGPLQKGP